MLVFYFMEWRKVYYNGLETNVEVTKCGCVRKIRVDWMKYNTKIGVVNFSKLKLHSNEYKQLNIQIKTLKTKTLLVHQLVAAAFLNYKWNGTKFVVDHRDSNRLNNNLSNLRVVTNRENSSKEKTLKSGLPVGVYFDKLKNKYKSEIRINGKKTYLGYYNKIEEASNAYQSKLKTI